MRPSKTTYDPNCSQNLFLNKINSLIMKKRTANLKKISLIYLSTFFISKFNISFFQLYISNSNFAPFRLVKDGRCKAMLHFWWHFSSSVTLGILQILKPKLENVKHKFLLCSIILLDIVWSKHHFACCFWCLAVAVACFCFFYAFSVFFTYLF